MYLGLVKNVQCLMVGRDLVRGRHIHMVLQVFAHPVQLQLNRNIGGFENATLTNTYNSVSNAIFQTLKQNS